MRDLGESPIIRHGPAKHDQDCVMRGVRFSILISSGSTSGDQCRVSDDKGRRCRAKSEVDVSACGEVQVVRADGG